MVAGVPYDPTPADREKDRQMVFVMASAGVEQKRIAAVLRINTQTLRKHFRRELDTGMDQANAMVVATMYRAATAAGKKEIDRATVDAAKFWLMARMGWLERSSMQHEGGDRPIEYRFSWAEKPPPDVPADGLPPIGAELGQDGEA